MDDAVRLCQNEFSGQRAGIFTCRSFPLGNGILRHLVKKYWILFILSLNVHLARFPVGNRILKTSGKTDMGFYSY